MRSRLWEFLFARQHEQFSIRCKQIVHGILKLTTGADAVTHLIGPRFGNAFDATLSGVHEGQGPTGVARVVWFGAMASRLAAAGSTFSQRAGQ